MWQSSLTWRLLLIELSSVVVVSLGISTDHPEDVVQMLAGTGTQTRFDNSDGNTLPQIKMPWGFNDWVPQTTGNEGSWFFYRGDHTFEGMRCTHQPSPWIGDYGHFLLQPHSEQSSKPLSWSPENAVFRPYLFNATLEGIGFELVPTTHAAILRLNFPHTGEFARLSLGGRNQISLDNGTHIQGTNSETDSGAVPRNWRLYFTVKALSRTKLAKEDSERQEGTLDFVTGEGPVLVAVATSFISQAQADLNLKQEVGSKSFQELLAEGRGKWSQQLGRVRVDAIDNTQLSVFYTNLWKSMLFPRYLQEVDENGKEVHRSPFTGSVASGKMVVDSGFWDSYRTVYHLQSLVFPDNMGSTINAWVDAFEEAHWLPEWPSPDQSHNGMQSTMGDVVLADAIAKNKWGFLSGFDVNKAYEAIKKDAFHMREGLFGRKYMQDYLEKGYVPASDDANSVSMSLDNYIADAAIARAAGILGMHEDERVLSARSKRYGIIFNKQTGFFQPKDAAGNFQDYFDPLDWGSGFTEAGAWQYRFSVPHDVEGLNKLYDGKLCDAIKSMMEYTNGEAFHPGSYGEVIHEMRELQVLQSAFGLYAHGNQPVHHILYVAKKAGCNSIADKYLRKVMSKLYTTSGWAGDEDNGEMGSWYVLSALGIYALEGAKDELVLGSPAIKHASVQLPNKKTLTVIAENQAEDHVYVQSATWTPIGGTAHATTGNVIKFTELMRGGTLTFKMGTSPKASPSLRATSRH